MIPDVSPCCACANIKIRPQHAMSAHPTARPLSLILTSAKNKVRRELQLITAPRHYFSALNCRLWWSVGRGERLFLGSPILSWCGSLTAMMGLSILLLEVVVVKKIPKTFTYFVWASLQFPFLPSPNFDCHPCPFCLLALFQMCKNWYGTGVEQKLLSPKN